MSLNTFFKFWNVICGSLYFEFKQMLLKQNNMTKYTRPNEMHPFFSWKYYSSNYLEIWYLRGHWLISHRSLWSWIPAHWMMVSNLFKDISRSIFFGSDGFYITHCFKCGVKMSVFPTNGGFSFPQKKFHCGSMVLLTVIFFLSLHLQVPLFKELWNCLHNKGMDL